MDLNIAGSKIDSDFIENIIIKKHGATKNDLLLVAPVVKGLTDPYEALQKKLQLLLLEMDPNKKEKLLKLKFV